MGTPAQDDLLTRLTRGDEDAPAALVAAYGLPIYRLAYRHLRNREDAEEVAQDVLYKVYRNAGEFRGESALSSWIYRITFNASMSRLRAAKVRRAADERRRADAAGASGTRRRDPADSSEMADERVLRSQLRRRVLRAVLALPPIYRAPVVLRDIQGMTTEEASARLHVKDQTLKSRLHRGRLILRRQLADLAGGVSLHRPLFGT